MKRYTSVLASAALAAAFLVPAFASASVVYNAVPSPLPPNAPSEAFQATQTSQFGDYVHLGGTDRILTTVTVAMSDWALYSNYTTDGRYSENSTSWTHPITLNVYNVVPGSPNTVGSLIGTVTQNITIPWRPATDPSCPGGTAWKASDGQCYNGIAFNATFDLSSLNVTLPNDIIVGIAYNTQTYGAVPIGSGGPYDSLNVLVPNGQPVTVGSDDSVDRVFWNTTYSGHTAGFKEDTGWTPNGTVAMQINAVTPTGSINITKYACPDGTTVTRSANGVDGAVPAGCALQSGMTFGYVHGTQTDANAPFPELTTALTAGGATNGSGVLAIPNLPATGRYLVVETNGSNQQLAAGDILGLYCTGDADTSGTNDNQELTFVSANATTSCIAYNKALPTFKVVVAKFIDGVQATAGSANSSSFPMVSTTTASNINNGVQTGGNAYTLDINGAYHATTTDMASGASYATSEVTGGNTVGASCSDGKPYMLNGYSSSTTLALAAATATTTSAPSFSNLTNDEYVIVWNKTCPIPASVVTNPATLVTPTSATVNGTNGPSNASDTSFWLGTTAGGPFTPSATPATELPSGWAGVDTFAQSASAAFNYAYTGLTPNTTYYFVAWAQVGGTWYPGAVLNFTTATNPTPPANACTLTQAPQGYTLRNGTAGSDTVTLAPFTMFVGNGGNDKVTGPDGNYIVCTGAGNDTITLGNGDDTINAGAGNNTITTGNGAGPITTGAGNDTITTGNGAHTIDAAGGNNTITTGDGVQNVTTLGGNDKITTGSGADTIDAGNGNNTVTAGAGDDTITAGSGNDTINGGPGTDTCTPGSGHNTVTNCEVLH